MAAKVTISALLGLYVFMMLSGTPGMTSESRQAGAHMSNATTPYSKETFSREVLELHVFLQQWLQGAVGEDAPGLARLEDALTSDFLVVHPTGSTDSRSGAVSNFAGAHGSRAADYRLVISDIDVKLVGGGIGIVTYRESHRGAGQSGRDRIATAVLKMLPESGAVEWLHLHETYLPSER